jgi:hypothetical protein
MNETGLLHAHIRCDIKTYFSLAILVLVSACVSQKEHDALQAEAHTLHTQNSTLLRQAVADRKQIQQLQRTVKSTLDTVERLAASSRSAGTHMDIPANPSAQPGTQGATSSSESEQQNATTSPGGRS